MKRTLIVTVLFAAMSLLNINCSKKSGTTSPSDVNYDGVWTGTTSQGKIFSFTVSSGSITILYIGYSLSGSCSSAPTGQTITFNIPRVINGNSFSITGTANISGTFSSAQHATGVFNIDFSGGAGCSSTAAGTWTANK